MIEILVLQEIKTIIEGEEQITEKWTPLDVDKNVGFNTFSLSIKQSDVNDPTAIFTNYSKSFSVPGTKRNLQILNYINRPDSNKTENKTKKCIVNNDGILIDRGYIRIETVTEINGLADISCTFYSELCSLLSNLKTNSNNEPYKMQDMFYGFYDEDNDNKFTNKTDEDTKYRFAWESWNLTKLINSLSRENVNDAVLDVKNKYAVLPVFSHDGYYEDFANNKVLMYMGHKRNEGDPDTKHDDYMPTNLLDKLSIDKTTMNSYISNTNRWACFEEARDLSARESKCYNAKKLKIGVRNSFILDAICNPENNGGYNLKFSDEVKDSVFYKNTFCIFDNVTGEEYEQSETNTQKWPSSPKTFSNIVPFTATTYKYNTPLSLEDYTDPKLKLTVPEINFNLEISGSKYLFLNRGPSWGSKFNTVSFLINIYVGDSSGTIKNLVKSTIYTTRTYGVSAFYTGHDFGANFNNENNFKTSQQVILEQMENGSLQRYYNDYYDVIKNADYVVGNYMYDEETSHYKFITNEENITADLTNKTISGNNYIYYELIPFCFDKNGNYTGLITIGNEVNNLPSNSQATFAQNFTNNDSGIIEPILVIPTDGMILYDSANIGSYDTSYNKEVIFKHLNCTPADYLLSFTKLLNLKFYYERNGDITIMNNREYYSQHFSQIKNLEAFIDKSKQIEYDITPYESKIYKYCYKDNDTYTDYLIEKTTGNHPNTVLINTDAEGNDEKNVLDKLIWTNALDYRFNTPYIGHDYGVASPIADGNYMYINQWNGSRAAEMETKDSILVRPGGEHYVEDDVEMLCLFDKKYDPIDENITLQFLRGVNINYLVDGSENDFRTLVFNEEVPDTDADLAKSINKLFCIVDKMPIMKEMSDEDECYIRVNYKDLTFDTATEIIYQAVPNARMQDYNYNISKNTKICVPEGIIIFGNVHEDYIGNSTRTVCLNYDANNEYLSKRTIDVKPSTIFEYGLSSEAGNLYSGEQTELKATCVFGCDNNVNDMLRKIFKYNSQYWYINEISNLKIVDNKYVGTFKFYKLLNWNSYIDFEIGVMEDDVL